METPGERGRRSVGTSSPPAQLAPAVGCPPLLVPTSRRGGQLAALLDQSPLPAEQCAPGSSWCWGQERRTRQRQTTDRKSTRLNSSHVKISYAVFCLKKKNKHYIKPKSEHHSSDTTN